MNPSSLDGGKQVTFYDIGLACEAAPGIGCGVRGKPILESLESNALVFGAWLSRSGKTLAIEWADEALKEDQQWAIICTALGADLTIVSRIADAARLRATREEFAHQRSWYRSNEIDELSQEEGWVIAHRLLRRMLAIINLGPVRQEAIKRVIATVTGEVLSTSAPGTVATREKLIAEAILKAACCELNESELDALRRALNSGGHRPIAGEA